MDKINLFFIFGIIVILFLNIYKFNGFAINENQGLLNISIISTASINFTLNNIDFGTGNVNSGKQNATIDTLGTVIDGNFTPVNSGFILENIGNANLTLNLKNENNASQFLGGTNPSYLYNVSENETGSCVNRTIRLNEWYNVNKSGQGTRICDVFNYDDAADTVRVDLKLVIPSDSFTGERTDTFTATGTVL